MQDDNEAGQGTIVEREGSELRACAQHAVDKIPCQLPDKEEDESISLCLACFLRPARQGSACNLILHYIPFHVQI